MILLILIVFCLLLVNMTYLLLYLLNFKLISLLICPMSFCPSSPRCGFIPTIALKLIIKKLTSATKLKNINTNATTAVILYIHLGLGSFISTPREGENLMAVQSLYHKKPRNAEFTALRLMFIVLTAARYLILF